MEAGSDWSKVIFGNLSAYPTLFLRLKEAQEKYETLQKRGDKALKGELPSYTIGPVRPQKNS